MMCISPRCDFCQLCGARVNIYTPSIWAIKKAGIPLETRLLTYTLRMKKLLDRADLAFGYDTSVSADQAIDIHAVRQCMRGIYMHDTCIIFGSDMI